MEAYGIPQDCPSGDDAVRPGKKNVYVQLVLSLALGLSAFVAFCVSFGAVFLKIGQASLIVCPPVDPTAPMEDSIQREKTAPGSPHWPARAPRQLLGMDSCTLQGDGRAGPGFRRARRLRGMAYCAL